ncbi:flagellar hook-associated protein 3 [Vibrio sp. HA2012]|uniref:flagellar hook-associated protein FlgL n=1 Tax=Vibrio sp. HA2012 TaxID=1971595 RepID=UPI000C2CBCA1|nr:flagellar hook-associated protein FlgL [Vibrio sp. HA2012]PJC85990.1 flagellar hook-associated protein 3 [Vibrio sp. HA2012]
MVGRISSFHSFQAVQNDLRNQEVKIQHNQEQLASGKKLLNSSDDPLATHYLQNIGQQEEMLRQYMDAIVLVRNRLEHNEVLIGNSEEQVDTAKRTVMEMINGAHSEEDRIAKCRELQEIFTNLMSTGNSQDELGNYIFSGTKSKDQPFFRNSQNEVTYAGDQYYREMKISNQIEMPLNSPGSAVYMEVENPFGDYVPEYKLQSGSELLLERATNSYSLVSDNIAAEDKPEYTITFVDWGDGGYGYQLEEDGSVVAADKLDLKEGIQYEDLNIKLKGQITAGDSITLKAKEKISIFDSLKRAIDLQDASVSDASSTADLHRVTEELNAGFVHLTKVHTDIGSRLKTLDIQEDQHEDFKLTLAKSRSSFEDLDYAQAVVEFNENSLALEASQKAFGKVKGLTLFNYLN